MKLNQKYSFGGNSSGFYKDKNISQKPWYLRLWFYVQSWSLSGWDYLRKISWILSSAFLILGLPTIMLKMLEFENAVSADMQSGM